ncbi:MAG: hypothetical protein R2856_07115 [Caldilineaceae bacterium]
MFNSTQAIKVAHAEERGLATLPASTISAVRSWSKIALLTQVVDMLGNSTTAIGTGLVLLIAAQAMVNDAFTIGDFALFTTNIWAVTVWMRIIGNMITHSYQVGVSFQRMENLMQAHPAPR